MKLGVSLEKGNNSILILPVVSFLFWAGLAACNYFLAKYEEAVIASANINIFFRNNFVKRFTLKCEYKSCESFNNTQNESNYSDSNEDEVLAYNVTENSY